MPSIAQKRPKSKIYLIAITSCRITFFSLVFLDCRDVKPQSVEEAKRRLRLQILTNAEGGDAVSDIAYQTSVLNKPVPTRELLCLVQEVGIDQVKAAAARVLTGKMSLTTLGEMQDGPYLKDL